MREFYTAYQSGLEAVAIFETRTEDFEDERVINHNEQYYTVIRTYEKGDFIELTCQKRQGIFEEVRV